MTPLADAGLRLIAGHRVADHLADIRDGKRPVNADTRAWLYNAISARALSVAIHGPDYVMDAARIWTLASMDRRRRAAQEIIRFALAAGAEMRRPAETIRDCHPLCKETGANQCDRCASPGLSCSPFHKVCERCIGGSEFTALKETA